MIRLFDWLFGPSKPTFAVLRHPDGTFEAVKYNRYGHDFSIDEAGDVMVPSHLRSLCRTESEARDRVERYKTQPTTQTVWQE